MLRQGPEGGHVEAVQWDQGQPGDPPRDDYGKYLYDTFQEQRPISVPWGSKFKVCYFRLAMILLVWNSAPINLSMYFYAKLCLVALKFEISLILKGFSEMLKKN